MLRSMTGFGAAAGQSATLRMRAEVRSLNHRHLQVRTRLPAELADLETEIDLAVRRRVERGMVQVALAIEPSPDTAGGTGTLLDTALARRYAEAAQGLGRELGLDGRLELRDLLALPGVALAGRAAEIDAGARATALELVERALEALVEMRVAEGRALGAALRKHLARLEALVAKIEGRMPAVVKHQQQGLRRSVADLLGRGAALPAADVAREIALLADRADVSEELVRLASHVAQTVRALEGDQASGRKLEFLVQECQREINTVGSKCADARVVMWVVEAKTEIERLREQVQNLE